MAADTLAQIAKLLDSERAETQMAAAIVLGELRSKDPSVVRGLCQLAQSKSDALRVAAIGALEQIGSPKALPVLLDALGGSQAAAQAATSALVALGEAAVPELQARMKEAPPWAQARISEVLARLSSGKKGLGALLDAFLTQDKEAVVRSALAFRQEIRELDPKERKACFAQVSRFLESARCRDSEAATVGAMRILGYLEDERAVDVLLEHAGPKCSPAIRVEALLSLRFALGNRRDAPPVARALLKLAADGDRRVAFTALSSLINLDLTASAIPALAAIARRPEDDLALAALERMTTLGSAAGDALLQLGLELPPARASKALAALGQSGDPRGPLFKALLDARDDAARARIAALLAPWARSLDERERRELASAARGRLKRSLASAEPLLGLLRDADRRGWAEVVRDGAAAALARSDEAGARQLYDGLLKSGDARDEDRLALARLELRRSRLGAPHADPAWMLLRELARRGASIAESLAADRAITPEQRFWAGFHLAELPEGEGRDVGHELLLEVSKGRTKLAKQARNKLRTTGYEA